LGDHLGGVGRGVHANWRVRCPSLACRWGPLRSAGWRCRV
jgi:hypothetical protein